MLRTLAIGTLILAGAATVASAEVYRWVDEHGSVHYSDQWVPGSQLIKSTRPRPAQERASSSDTTRGSQPTPSSIANQALADSAQRSTENAVKQDVARIRESQCKEAKDRYEKAIQARRIFKATGPNDKAEDRPDNRQYMSDEEADAYRLQARKDMEDVCGSK